MSGVASTTESPRVSKQCSCTHIPKAREPRSVEGMTRLVVTSLWHLKGMAEQELAYKRKARRRGKNRKLRISMVYELNNLRTADHEARRGKDIHKGVKIFDRKPEANLLKLQKMLSEGTYHTSPGHECVRHCPCGKDRLLHKLPYYPDHIEHHGLMQIIMPLMMKAYYYDSSASIKGKGMHFAANRTEHFIDKNKKAGRIYYAKLDFVKFYHNINQEKIYQCLCKKFGDKGIRYLIHEVVTACEEGLGIGLFPIQPMANFYTCPLCRILMALFDVWVEIYCDDLVIMGLNKKEVWKAVNYVKWYAENVMEQPLHENIGVQIIDEHNRLDFVGYQFFFNYTLLRKRMKARFKQKMHRLKDPDRRYKAATSYKGWLLHCNGFHLWCQVMNMKSFKDLQVPSFEKKDADGKRMLEGTKVSASMLCGREIIFSDVEFGVKSKYKKEAAVVQVEENGQKYKFFTCNQKLIQTLQYVNSHDEFPFKGTLVRVNNSGLPDYSIQ